MSNSRSDVRMNNRKEKLRKEIPHEGIVVIRPTNTGQLGTAGMLTFREVDDPDAKGAKIPFYNGIGEGGRVEKLTDPPLYLDLSNPDDYEYYLHILVHPYYTKDNGGKKLVKVEDITQESKSQVKKKKKELEALDLIREIENKEQPLKRFARLMGINANDNKEVILSRLYQKCEDRPEEVIRVYNADDRKLRELVKEAEELGVITKDSGVRKYGDTTLGSSFERTIEYLKEDEEGKALKPELRKQIEKAK